MSMSPILCLHSASRTHWVLRYDDDRGDYHIILHDHLAFRLYTSIALHMHTTRHTISHLCMEVE